VFLKGWATRVTDRYVVLRLTNSPYDGEWRHAPVWVGDNIVATVNDTTIRLVPTGNVEWRDDGMAAMVYVPEDKLDVWRAEHDVDSTL
jgi:hypothetical protein